MEYERPAWIWYNKYLTTGNERNIQINEVIIWKVKAIYADFSLLNYLLKTRI